MKLGSTERIQLQWNLYLQAIRYFFHQSDFLEVQTPTLVTCPGTEPFLDLFSSEFKSARVSKKYFLPTSPEIHLKKAIMGGYTNIFEIKNCFRNGEISETHQPEFLMLEWYRVGSDLSDIKADIHRLLGFLHEVFLVIEFLPKDIYKILTHAEINSRAQAQIAEKTMAQLFKEFLSFDLTPQTQLQELKTLAVPDLQVENYTDWDDVFYLLFIEKVEPRLQTTEPLFVTNYPPSQAAYAKLTADGWGDRFELYWKGLEIANAFNELNDAQTQKTRMLEDLDKKKALGKELVPLDEDFLNNLSKMPQTAGIALGLERLFMALTNTQNISALKVFPYSL